MISLVYGELTKLRRHSLLWLGLLGAAAPVALNTLWYLMSPSAFMATPEGFFSQSLFMLTLLEGSAGAAIVGSMLFGREHAERTLPNLLVSAVPREAWMGAKWTVLAILGLGIVMGSWLLTLGTTALLMGSHELRGDLVLGSLAAYGVAAGTLYGTSSIAVGLTLAARNVIAGVGWGVLASMASIMVANSKYAVVFPGSVPFVSAAMAFERVYPAIAEGRSVAELFAWVGLPAALTAALVTVAVWAAGLAFSLWHVHRADAS